MVLVFVGEPPILEEHSPASSQHPRGLLEVAHYVGHVTCQDRAEVWSVGSYTDRFCAEVDPCRSGVVSPANPVLLLYALLYEQFVHVIIHSYTHLILGSGYHLRAYIMGVCEVEILLHTWMTLTGLLLCNTPCGTGRCQVPHSRQVNVMCARVF